MASTARRVWRAPVLLALAGYLVAASVVTWPLLRRLGRDTYGGPGDGWALIWQTRERFELGPAYFRAMSYPDIAWPFGTSFPSGILLSNVATEFPNLLLLAVGLGDVSAYNVMTLAVGVASATTMFVVLRRLGTGTGAAVWGGLVLLLMPWELDRLAIHMTLALIVGLPLILLGVVEWARRPDRRSGLVIVLGVAIAVHTHVYYALMAVLALALAVPVVVVMARRAGRLRQTLVRSAVLGGALIVVALPLLLALVTQSSSVVRQLNRPLYLSDFALKPHLLALPSEDNWVFGGRVRDHIAANGLVSNTGELALYLGWLTVALAVVGAVAAVRGRVPRLPAVVAGTWIAAGLVLSLPAELDLPAVGETSMPVAYLQELTTFISTPTRFFVMVMIGAIVLAALGLRSLRPLVGARGWVGLVGAAVLISAIELPTDPGTRLVDAADRPPVVRALTEVVPPGEPVAQYPSVDRSLQAVADQLYWQTVHGHPVLNGAASQSFEDAVRRAVEAPQDPRTPGLLALLGFRWLSIDPAGFATSPYGYSEAVIPTRGTATVAVLSDGARIHRITAPPAPGIAVEWAGFSTEGPTADTRWLTGTRGSLVVCATRAGRQRVSFASSVFAQPRTLRIGTALVRVPARPVLVRVGVELDLRAGWQVLPMTLVGSRPQRPIDLVEGSDDTRPLSVALGRLRVDGPPGDPRVCRARPPDALLDR